MFTESADEQYGILNPFIQDGLDSGDEVLTIVDDAFRGAHAERLQGSGIPVDETLASGQLRILASEDTYGRDGTFAAERMYALLEEVLETSAAGQWNWMRVIGDAGWVLRTMQGSDELMAYEAKVNLLAPRHACTLLCVYDINQCSGQVIADAQLLPHEVEAAGPVGGHVVEAREVGCAETGIGRVVAVGRGAANTWLQVENRIVVIAAPGEPPSCA